MRGRSVGRSRGTLRSDDERGADQGFGKRGGGNSGQQRRQEVQGPLPLLRQNAVQVMPFFGLSTQSWFDTKYLSQNEASPTSPPFGKGGFPPCPSLLVQF